MDLELLKFIVSIAFLALLLIKQHLDGGKIERQYFESKDVFKSMPRVTEASVDCLRRLHEQMVYMTRKMESLNVALEAVADKMSAPGAKHQ